MESNRFVHIAGTFVTLADISVCSGPDKQGCVTVTGQVLDEDGNPGVRSEFIIPKDRLVTETVLGEDE